jgi:ribosomal protein S12 methylthiotransferase accessory factor
LTTVAAQDQLGHEDVGESAVVWGERPAAILDALVLALPGCSRSREEAAASVAVAVGSAYADDAIRRANDDAHGGGPVLLPVQVELGTIVIGPLVLPGRPGCYLCTRTRGRDVRSCGPAGDLAVWTYLRGTAAGDGADVAGGRVTVDPTSIGLMAAARVAAGIVADDVAALRSGRTPRCLGAVFVVDIETLANRRHAFLPVSDCPACGSLPDDTLERAVVTMGSSPPGRSKADPRPPASLAERHEELLSTYVDDRLGVISGIKTDLTGPVVTAGAQLSRFGNHISYGWGRLPGRASTEILAVFEALERLAGLSPRGKQTLVRATFADLSPEHAVDPVSLGLPDVPPPADSMEYTSAVRDTCVPWVYGYSFRRQHPILVPESYAYYGRSEDERAFAYECSNGCALGSTIEQAILNGLCEVAERDAFLTTWYARLPVPRLDPRSVHDPTTHLIIDAVEDETGMRLHVFDITMTEGIPSLWVAFVDESDQAAGAKAYFGAAANIEPERALRSAVLECSVSAVRGHYIGQDADRTAQAREMLTDSDRVTTMEHHSQLYALPEAWPRLDFLYQRKEIQTFAEAFTASANRRPPGDTAGQLREALDRYLANDLDVIVVDQTTPEHRPAGLHCVKVIVPGTLPMTFGHRFRRAATLPRLRHAPVRLGYVDHPLTDSEINPYPHPFP